jgi:hypothetical protein
MTYSYIPGTCNLGKAEIRRRQFVALLGLILTISSFTGLIAAGATQTARFSLAYGLMGTFNLGKLGDLTRVQSPEDRKADRKTAIGILLQSAALAAVLTLALVAMPL